MQTLRLFAPLTVEGPNQVSLRRQYLQGHGDLASRLITPRNNIVTLRPPDRPLNPKP